MTHKKREKELTARQIRERVRDANEEGADEHVVPDRNPSEDHGLFDIDPSEATRLAQARFFEAFAVSISDAAACVASGVSRSALSRWKRDNYAGFMDAYRVASESRIRNLEALLFDVVRHFGEDEERYEKILRYPTLPLRLMQAHDPKYRADTAGQSEDAKRSMEILSQLPNDPPKIMTPEKDLEDQLDDIFGNKEQD